MHAPTPLHESCDLKQARPQRVSMLTYCTCVPATPSQVSIIPLNTYDVNRKMTFALKFLKKQTAACPKNGERRSVITAFCN